MIVSAHQPAFIPWLGYFHKIALADVFVIMDDVQFEKNSFTNRNKILNNGAELWLTIPVKMKNHLAKKINELEIADTFWKKKHLKTIEQNYKNAPYFKEVFSLITDVYHLNSLLFTDYTNQLLAKLLAYLNISTKIIFASTLDIKGKKLDYVVELTKKLSGDIFVFGKQGVNYADESYLQAHHINAYFQDYQHPVYPQPTPVFLPYLSILDLLFTCGPESKKILLSGNIGKSDLLNQFSAAKA